MTGFGRFGCFASAASILAFSGLASDCRPIICSGQVPYRDAVELFRRLYESYPPTDKRLLEYAADRAPTSLPMVLRVLAQVLVLISVLV